jgi:uncharacterized membrane protein
MFQDNKPVQEQSSQSDMQSSEQQNIQEERDIQKQQPATTPQQQNPQEQKQGEAPQQQKSSVSMPVKIQTTQEERIWSAIGYIAFLGVVTLAMMPKSKFCRKHAAQGLTIFVLWFIGLIVMAMPSIIGAIGGLILLATGVLAVIGIIKSLQSYEFNLPVLSDIASKVPVDSIIGSVTGKTPPSTSGSSHESTQTTQTSNESDQAKSQSTEVSQEQSNDSENQSQNQ